MKMKEYTKTQDGKIFLRCRKKNQNNYWDVFVGPTRPGKNHGHFPLPIQSPDLPWNPASRGFVKRITRTERGKSTIVYENIRGKTTRTWTILVNESGEIISIKEVGKVTVPN